MCKHSAVVATSRYTDERGVVAAECRVARSDGACSCLSLAWGRGRAQADLRTGAAVLNNKVNINQSHKFTQTYIRQQYVTAHNNLRFIKSYCNNR